MSTLSNNVACPGNSGAYHSGDPSQAVDTTLLAGCALAIADVEAIGGFVLLLSFSSPSISDVRKPRKCERRQPRDF